jgi:hypothetical protein
MTKAKMTNVKKTKAKRPTAKKTVGQSAATSSQRALLKSKQTSQTKRRREAQVGLE